MKIELTKKDGSVIYKGYKIRVRCIDWEQIKTIDQYWKLFTDSIASEKIIGLGMNWSDDYLYFDYAVGIINDEETFNKIQSVACSNQDFKAQYVELDLPNLNKWSVYKGKDSQVKEIYENQIDCYNREYDYELEYIDSAGNIEIKIHYIDAN